MSVIKSDVAPGWVDRLWPFSDVGGLADDVGFGGIADSQPTLRKRREWPKPGLPYQGTEKCRRSLTAS